MGLKAMDAHRRAIRLWLYVVAALVVLMVMVGGATRLTDSGLSIVEWRPIAGTAPPLNEALARLRPGSPLRFHPPLSPLGDSTIAAPGASAPRMFRT